MDKTKILNKLDKVKLYQELIPSLKVSGKSEALGLCPFHDDHNPSLSVNIETGLFRCFSCDAKGDLFTFYQRFKDVDFPTALKEIGKMAGVAESDTKPKVVATFKYHDSEGRLLYIKERLEPGRAGKSKEFILKHLKDGQWILGRGGDPVLYRLPELIKSKYAFVVEGEGKADLLSKWGLVATSLDTGSNSPIKDEYIQILGSMEKVVILSDNDTPGRNYAYKIANLLHGKVNTLKVVELPGLKEAEDVIDWVRIAGNNKEKLIEIVKNVPQWTPKEIGVELEEKPEGKKKAKDKDEPVLSAYFQGLVDIVTDNSGRVAYLINNENSLEVAKVWEIDKVLYSPPDQRHLPFALASANNVLKWWKSDNDQRLFGDVLTYLKRFSYLPQRQWLIVTYNVFLSYLQDHPDIHYLPMLLFYAVPERGKSRTGKAVSYISYRGVHIVDMREANLFRFSQNLRATLFFDMMDLWKKAEKNGAEDILLLRYEKGARATRVIYPEKGAFKDTAFYDIFGSTLIATNEAVHKILGSRCIDIAMPNKPGDYENPTPEKAQELKERLTAWRARVMNKPLPEIDIIQGLNGRLWDISKPLLQVCKLVYPQGFDELRGALLEVAGQRTEDKKESIEGRIVSTLYDLSTKELPEWKVKTSELLSKLNEERPDTHKLTSQYVGRKLKAMGLHTRHIHGLSEILLNRSDFDVLLEQYGICKNILPNSTNSTSPTESRDSTGRELVESAGHSTNIRPAESLVNSGQVELVESGRVSGGTGKENSDIDAEVEYSNKEVLI